MSANVLVYLTYVLIKNRPDRRSPIKGIPIALEFVNNVNLRLQTLSSASDVSLASVNLALVS